MKQFKFYILISLLCLLSVLVVATAYSDWYFDQNSKIERESAVGVDNIKPNVFLEDDLQSSQSQRKYYNAYFLAQNVKNVMEFLLPDGKITVGGQEKDNYKINTAIERQGQNGPYYIHNNSIYNTISGDYSLGKWESGTPYYQSAYFKVLNHVSDISYQTVTEIGVPSIDLAMKTGVQYKLYFTSWFLNGFDVYVNPSRNGSTIQVEGTYPISGVDIATFDQSLSKYDDRAIYINGQASIIFYPGYSHGKSNINNINTARDLNVIRDAEYSSNGNTEYNKKNIISTYDTEVSAYLNNLPTEKRISELNITRSNGNPVKETYLFPYRYTNFQITEDMYKALPDGRKRELRILIQNRRFGGAQQNEFIVFNGSNSANRLNLLDPTSGLNIGAYNIYVFDKGMSKSSAITEAEKNSVSFTANEIATINEFFTDYKKTSIYKSYLQNAIILSNTICKSVYVVVEKLYSVNVLGGNNNSFTDLTQSGLDLRFSYYDSDQSNQLVLSGLELNTNSNEYIVHNINNKEISIPKYYFTFTLNASKDKISNINLGVEQPVDHDGNLIKNKYYDSIKNEIVEESFLDSNQLFEIVDLNTNSDILIDGIEVKEYIKENQNDDIINFLTELNLIKPKLGGIYNIFIDIVFNDEGSSISLWGAPYHDLIVTVYDLSDEINGKSMTVDELKSNMITYDHLVNYSFQSETAYYRNTDIRDDVGSSMKFIRNERITNNQDLPKSLDLVGLISEYESRNKMVYDLVSGRVLTAENLESNPIIMTRSIVLIVTSK